MSSAAPTVLAGSPDSVGVRLSLLSAFLIGLALTVLQIALVLIPAGTCPLAETWSRLLCDEEQMQVRSASREAGLAETWSRLLCDDSGWYACIIDMGYHSQIPPHPDTSNVAFFPGYPLCAGLLKELLGVNTDVALLLAAQAACCGFWTYLLLTWQHWRVPPGLAVAGTLAILVHPAAFFLVCGYSESLFLMMMVGFLYWAQRSRRAFPLAALHGCLMTATRLVGLAVALVPLVERLLPGRNRDAQRLPRCVLLAGLASLGAGLFFGWCHYRFGHWDLYQQSQAIGWDVRPDYLAILDWRHYLVRFWCSKDWLQCLFWSRLTLPVTVCLLAALLWHEQGQPPHRVLPGGRLRAGLYFAAGLIFYISTSAMSGRDMDSMLRHHLVIHVLLVMAVVHRLTAAGNWTWWRVAWWTLPAGICFLLQCYFAYRFTHGLWVA